MRQDHRQTGEDGFDVAGRFETKVGAPGGKVIQILGQDVFGGNDRGGSDGTAKVLGSFVFRILKIGEGDPVEGVCEHGAHHYRLGRPYR